LTSLTAVLEAGESYSTVLTVNPALQRIASYVVYFDDLEPSDLLGTRWFSAPCGLHVARLMVTLIMTSRLTAGLSLSDSGFMVFDDNANFVLSATGKRVGSVLRVDQFDRKTAPY
jgi:hypothetical protein